jgi:hypothetical protein
MLHSNTTSRDSRVSTMMNVVIIIVVLAIIAAAIVITRNRRLRTRGRKGSRYFSISLTNPDVTELPEDRPH